MSQKALVRYLYLTRNLGGNYHQVTRQVFLSQVENELI